MIRYRLVFEPDDNGTILVTSPDLPLVTFGADKAEATRQADDAAHALLQSMIDAREGISIPSFEGEAEGEAVFLKLPLLTELKVGLHNALLSRGNTRADLQRRLGWQRESVDRLFRLDHNSKVRQIEEAFEALGKNVGIKVLEDA